MPTATTIQPDPERRLILLELTRRIEAGDAAAEEELARQLSPGLRVILRHLTSNPALADDIHQETLAVVLRTIRARELRQPEALAAFVRATARNLLLADRRKEARYTDLGTEPEAALDRLQAPAEPSASPPLRRLIAAEEARIVRRLLDELRHPRDRELLLRVYLEEDEKEVVCRELDIDPGLYNRVLFRARQRLRELWERSEKRQRIFAGTGGGQRSRDPSGFGDTSSPGGETRS